MPREYGDIPGELHGAVVTLFVGSGDAVGRGGQVLHLVGHFGFLVSFRTRPVCCLVDVVVSFRSRFLPDLFLEQTQGYPAPRHFGESAAGGCVWDQACVVLLLCLARRDCAGSEVGYPYDMQSRANPQLDRIPSHVGTPCGCCPRPAAPLVPIPR